MIPNNVFLTGVVEDILDPLHMGRVRVRWIGIHTPNKAKLPTELLPWANVMGSINSAGISGVGMSPVGMVNGTMVFGLPLDEGMQEFLILGTLAGNRSTFINSSFGFNDPNGEYPRPGVLGDINKRAGGNADNGSVIDSNSISSNIPGGTDPTMADKILDPESYKDAPWMTFAQGELGINETDNATKIKEYHTVGGGLMQEPTVAWCAAFIGWCLDKVSINGTRSASSRSYLNYGQSLGKDNVKFGAIAVFGVPNSGSGHVTFVVEDKGDSLVCIGGNQSDKSARSGGIVSRTTIPKNGKSLVLLNCVYPTNLQGR
jgi:uncharacterized protein (TIGR02594 family)